MVRPGRRASDILRQVPAFDAAGWAVPRHVAGGPFAQQGDRGGQLAGQGPITRQVAEDLHRYADERKPSSLPRAHNIPRAGAQHASGGAAPPRRQGSNVGCEGGGDSARNESTRLQSTSAEVFEEFSRLQSTVNSTFVARTPAARPLARARSAAARRASEGENERVCAGGREKRQS